MKSQGILNLKESSVSVEVANMPITMLTVPPSEISLEVIKILDKQKRINFLWTYISLFASLVITLVTAEKFNKFVFSGEFWKFTFCALAIYFLYKILNTLWNIRKKWS